MHYFPPFDGHFEFLNISKCSMMPRWHHSDSSSERYQEVKAIKTFYAAHISRSQAKSMFGNWTMKVKVDFKSKKITSLCHYCRLCSILPFSAKLKLFTKSVQKLRIICVFFRSRPVILPELLGMTVRSSSIEI